MNRDENKMLNELMQLDFRLRDLLLFLDTHPTEQRAIKEYNETLSKARLMRENYEKLYRPLSAMGNAESNDYWKWVNGPWPWQYCEKGAVN